MENIEGNYLEKYFNENIFNPLILDFGTHTTKFGFYRSNYPILERSCLGIERKNKELDCYSLEQKNAQKKQDDVLKYHVFDSKSNFNDDRGNNDVIQLFEQRGLVKNYHHFETFFEEIIKKNQQKLGIELKNEEFDFMKNTPVDIITSLFTPKNQREKICQIFFETYEIPDFHVEESYLSSLYFYDPEATNEAKQEENFERIVVVADVGSEQTKFTPIRGGYYLPHACEVVGIGGDIITDELTTLFSKPSKKDDTSSFFNNRVVAEQMKKDFCYFSLNYDFSLRCAERGYSSLFDNYRPLFTIFPVEIIRSFHHFAVGPDVRMYKEKYFKLPDEHTILTLKSEQFDSPELYFHPTDETFSFKSRFSSEKLKCGIIDVLEKVIEGLDVDYKRLEDVNVKYEGVYFCGGGSLVDEFEKKVLYEIERKKNLLLDGLKVFVKEHREVSAWLGSKHLLSLPGIRNSFINRDMYDDAGPSVVHRRMGFC